MAHYIAELITESKNTNVKNKRLIQKKCFDTILALWQHHNVMPDGNRPFEDLEPIVRTIERLNPDKNTIHYSHSARSSIISDEESDETNILLKKIEDIDYSARVMIADYLAQASCNAVDKSKEWIRLAKAAEIDPPHVERILQFISSDGEITKVDHNLAGQLKYLTGQLKRFETLIEIANTFTADVRKQINELSNENEKENISKISGKKKGRTEKKKITKKRYAVKKRAPSKKTSSKKKTHVRRRTTATKGRNA